MGAFKKKAGIKAGIKALNKKDGETFRDRVRAIVDSARSTAANARRFAVRLHVCGLRLLVHFHQLLFVVSHSLLVVRASLSLLVRRRSTQSAQGRSTSSSRHRQIYRLEFSLLWHRFGKKNEILRKKNNKTRVFSNQPFFPWVFVPDGINSVGDYNSSRVGVVCLSVSVCPHFFFTFHDGITSKRFELLS